MEFVKENVKEEWLPVIEEFPEIFLKPSEYVENVWDAYYQTRGIKKEDLVNLRYGFEHGIGWKEIVRGFCEDMEALKQKAKENGDHFQYKGCIMKEKFGTFTPQGDVEADKETWTKYSEEYYKIMNKWEKASLSVCEVCGEPGKLRTKGWHKTLCDKHNNKKEK